MGTFLQVIKLSLAMKIRESLFFLWMMPISRHKWPVCYLTSTLKRVPPFVSGSWSDWLLLSQPYYNKLDWSLPYLFNSAGIFASTVAYKYFSHSSKDWLFISRLFLNQGQGKTTWNSLGDLITQRKFSRPAKISRRYFHRKTGKYIFK